MPLYDGSECSLSTQIDFTVVKNSTLEVERADVLYLLDSCYSATTALRPGKELIAATSIEDITPAPGSSSFTSSIIRELNNANKYHRYLTASQLWFLLLNDKHKGELEYTPIHSEVTVVGPQPRTSNLIAPFGHRSQEDMRSYPLTSVKAIPLGTRQTDLRVLLSVHLSDGNARTLQEMREWVTQRSHGIAGIGISFEYAAPSSSIILVFILPGPAYYCLASHEAIHFMSYVKRPEPEPQQQQEHQH